MRKAALMLCLLISGCSSLERKPLFPISCRSTKADVVQFVQQNSVSGSGDAWSIGGVPASLKDADEHAQRYRGRIIPDRSGVGWTWARFTGSLALTILSASTFKEPDSGSTGFGNIGPLIIGAFGLLTLLEGFELRRAYRSPEENAERFNKYLKDWGGFCQETCESPVCKPTE